MTRNTNLIDLIITDFKITHLILAKPELTYFTTVYNLNTPIKLSGPIYTGDGPSVWDELGQRTVARLMTDYQTSYRSFAQARPRRMIRLQQKLGPVLPLWCPHQEVHIWVHRSPKRMVFNCFYLFCYFGIKKYKSLPLRKKKRELPHSLSQMVLGYMKSTVKFVLYRSMPLCERTLSAVS